MVADFTIRYEGDKIKVMVTGGAGFIGSHIVDLIIDEGNEVVVIK